MFFNSNKKRLAEQQAINENIEARNLAIDRCERAHDLLSDPASKAIVDLYNIMLTSGIGRVEYSRDVVTLDRQRKRLIISK